MQKEEEDLATSDETLVENDLYPMVGAVRAAKNILTTAKKTFDELEVFVSDADEKISNLNAKLKKLQEEHENLDVEFEDEYLPKFNKAKSELIQVRHRLSKLADRTKTEMMRQRMHFCSKLQLKR